MKRHLGPIEGPRTRLRLLEEEDLAMTLAWRNREEVRRSFRHSDAVLADQHREWYARYVPRDDDFVFVIEETVDLKMPVGQVSLYRIDWAKRRAEFGRLLIGEPEARGHGLAREATQVLVRYAHRRLGLAEIELEVFEANTAAIAVYRSCGFRETGERDGLTLMRQTDDGAA